MWFKKKKKDDEQRKELMEAIEQRKIAAEELIARIDKCQPDRRMFDLPFEGPERRHA